MDNISRCDNFISSKWTQAQQTHFQNFQSFQNFGDKTLYIYIYSLKIQIMRCSHGDVTVIKMKFRSKMSNFYWKFGTAFHPLKIISVKMVIRTVKRLQFRCKISFLIENIEFHSSFRKNFIYKIFLFKVIGLRYKSQFISYGK